MVQRGSGLRLLLEAASTAFVGDVGGEELDGDGAVQAEIAGEIDNPHAALADLLLNAILTDGRTDHNSHEYIVSESLFVEGGNFARDRRMLRDLSHLQDTKIIL